MGTVIKFASPQRITRRKPPTRWDPAFLKVLLPEYDGCPDPAQAELDLRNARAPYYRKRLPR